MEEKRICRFCKEEMVYGPQTEIFCRSIKVDGKHISKTVKYVQFGWTCNRKDVDNCDVVFDEKDEEINRIKTQEAEERWQADRHTD